MNPSVKVLLINSTAENSRCIPWLTERSYVVDVAASGFFENTDFRQYAIILVEDTLQTTFPSLSEQGNVIVIANDYSPAGFRTASEQGAIGYIDKKHDKDTFIREVENILRRLGKLTRRGRLLVVDNDARVLAALKNNLGTAGYDVKVAHTAAKALHIVPEHLPHVVIVDIRLRDDDDPLDQSGFDLIKDIGFYYGHATRVIGLTGSPVRQTASKAVGIMHAFVLKDVRYGVTYLIPEIESAIESLGINRSLSIELEDYFSLPDLVNMVKAYAHYSPAQKALAVLELEELIRKLFRQTLKVKVYHLSPGRGGAGVVLIRPIIDNVPAEYFVIKFGVRENIRTELKNYNTFVKPFIRLGTQLVDIIDIPEETIHLGGLKFSFAGLSVEQPRDFNSFYLNPDTKQADIRQALENLFNRTCNRWYGDKKAWSEVQSISIAEAYESQLSMNSPDSFQELSDTVSEIAEGKPYDDVTIFRLSHSDLAFRWHEGECVLPDPVYFLQTNRQFFPVPKFACRTHGDLNGRNMFVDEGNKVWLIDFYKTGWGPTLRDFGELESVLKFELLRENNLLNLFLYEKWIIESNALGKDIYCRRPFDTIEFGKLSASITYLRQLAFEQYEADEMWEYNIGMLYYSLKMMVWQGVSQIDEKRTNIRKRHALISAAFLAHRLRSDLLV